MAQRMMWNHIESIYRGQASDGTVVTVDPEAMELAHKRAGRGVYESDWWVETLDKVLENWGIYDTRWIDGVTQNHRAHYSLEKGKQRQD